MSSVRNKDIEIHYMEWGRPGDPVIILVHGLMLSSSLFVPLATRLTGWRVIAVDVRGHGGSSRPRQPNRYSWKTMASDVLTVMDGLGIARAVIGGVSLGANVSLEFAHQYPSRVAALVIEMPVLSTSEGAARVFFGWVAQALQRASPWLEGPTAYVRGLPASSRSSALALLRNFMSIDALAAAALIKGLQVSPLPLHDVRALAKIDRPTLVIGHRADPIHHFKDAVALAGMIKNAELVSVFTIVDFRLFPDRYAATIDRFLRGHVISSQA